MDNEKGAVTAEFMLLMPAAILAVTLLLGFFNLAIERVKFEFEAFQFARSHFYALEPGSYEFEQSSRGELSCVEVVSGQALQFRSEWCLIPIGT